MNAEKSLSMLGFTQDWIEAGILSQGKVEELSSEFKNSDDKNTEHYRWKAFKNYMDNNPSLENIIQIYNLCKKESDDMLKDSMIHLLIRRSDFPNDLLVRESKSNVKSIAKVAKRKLFERDLTDIL